MRRVTLYRHPDCARCARIARFNSLLDWFRRVEYSTQTPPTGPLAMGAIAVTDHATGKTELGIDAARLVFRQIPAYALLLPLLRVPAVARKIDRDTRGCGGDACGV